MQSSRLVGRGQHIAKTYLLPWGLGAVDDEGHEDEDKREEHDGPDGGGRRGLDVGVTFDGERKLNVVNDVGHNEHRDLLQREGVRPRERVGQKQQDKGKDYVPRNQK